MKIKYSFVCEAANIASNGNLNVLGIFQNINAVEFPTVFARMIYVASIEFHYTEVGAHRFKVNFIDDDGKSVIPPLEGEIYVDERNLNSSILLGIENVRLPKPGIYAIDMAIDNHHIATDTINVLKVNQSGSGNQN